MRPFRLALALLFSASLPSVAAHAAWLVPVDASPGPRLLPPVAFSGNGQVVAGSCQDTVGSGITYPCLWTQAGGFERLGPDAAEGTGPQITALSHDGSVAVGALGGDLFSSGEAFRWTRDAGFVPLGTLPGGATPMSAALAVSADGSIVFGRSATTLGTEVFRWTEADGMQSIGKNAESLAASDDGRTIAVLTACSPGSGAFVCSAVWKEGVGWSEIPDPNFWAGGISGDGVLVVGSSLTDWQPATWSVYYGVSLLGPDPAWGARPLFPGAGWDASYEGYIVVGYDGSRDETFVWNSLQGRRSLSNALSLEHGIQVDKCRFHRGQNLSTDGFRVLTPGICTEMAGATYFLADLRPACMDGVDTDEDGLIDLADDGCQNQYDLDERPGVGCGLGGPDLALALLAIGAIRARRQRRAA